MKAQVLFLIFAALMAAGAAWLVLLVVRSIQLPTT